MRRANIGRLASAAYNIAKGLNLVVDVDLPVHELMKPAIVDRRRKGKSTPPVPPAAAANSSP